MISPVHDSRMLDVIDAALREDIGLGDVTTDCTVPRDLPGRGVFMAKSKGILSGIDVAMAVLLRVDPQLHVNVHMENGNRMLRGARIATVSGSVASMLTAERVSLNFLQRMSGIATRTAEMVRLVEGFPVEILDTRKTAPGLRAFDRQAVRDGGGTNHRFGLDDMVLIKDNHVRACGGVKEAVDLVRSRLGANTDLKIELEVESLPQLSDAITCSVDYLLLDNFRLDDLTTAVRMVRAGNPHTRIEVSGMVSEETIRDIAETGVDRISIGGLTHSVTALDISFEILSDAERKESA